MKGGSKSAEIVFFNSAFRLRERRPVGDRYLKRRKRFVVRRLRDPFLDLEDTAGEARSIDTLPLAGGSNGSRLSKQEHIARH